jgi:hypothetical protein
MDPISSAPVCDLEPAFVFDPTLTCIQDRVFTRRCALSGCHIGAGAQQGMSLAPGEAYDNVVGVPSVEMPALLRVAAGDPNASYLVMKIEGASSALPRMPLNRAPLSQMEIDVIREWVLRGALDN